MIDSAYETTAKLGSVESGIPYTTANATFDAARAAIVSSLQSNWKGPMSDQDTKRIEPLLPDKLDSVERIAEKKKQMMALLFANSKPTPILRSLGEAPAIPSEAIATGATSEIPAGMKLQRNKVTGETRLVPQ
jgi:hypothetical protein